MPKSLSYGRVRSNSFTDDDDFDAASLEEREQHDTYSSTTPTSPVAARRLKSRHPSDPDLTERSSLLGNIHGARSYRSVPASVPGTPRPHLGGQRHSSQTPFRSERLRHSRAGSISHNFSGHLVNALTSDRRGGLGKPFFLYTLGRPLLTQV